MEAAGLVAVLAVSGSVVFIAHQLHKRLLSDFMKKIEFELCGSRKYKQKKRVGFADDVMREPSSNNKEYCKMNHSLSLPKLQGNKAAGEDDHQTDQAQAQAQQLLEMSNSMPLNRQVLYKGILQYKTRHI
ncbi:rho GTPase-activating protein gacG-like [Gossypium australe]|uniref:Rho GTPase-activating protein gacG-like n=1 Tax=Gossypium australe TaxID=47621 RepID=A0A5B6UEC7_9ROSI|nr:rho GTPase-activating protein gacG-like [Gossypium australe]